MEVATRHGLRYLGESRLTTMVSGNFTPDVQKALQVVASDQVQAEQYMDFVRNRTFRETLLVRADAEPNWGIRPEAIRSLHVTPARRLDGKTAKQEQPSPTDDSGDVRSNDTVQYQTKSGMTLSTSSPVLKAAMRVLGERWPGTVSFAELDRAVVEMLGGQSDGGQTLALGLLNTYLAADLLELHAAPVAAVKPGERPVALASARARLAAGETGVANRRHELVRPNDLDRQLLPLLDGTRDRAALLDRLTEMALAKEITVQREGQPLADAAAIREALAPALEQALASLAAASLLAG
jgi:methyltransferase-like protein